MATAAGRTLSRTLSQSAWWNAFEALAYHAILATHNIALFSILSCEQYGTIGAMYSLLYLAVYLVDLGFDGSLAPFWHMWGTSAQRARQFFISNALVSLCFGPLLLLSVGYWAYTRNWLCMPLSPSFITLFFMVVIIEVVKRWCKHILYILFENILTATTEVVGLLCCSSILWLLYWCGWPIDTYTCLLPLALTSIVSIGVYSVVLLRWYNTLQTLPISPDNFTTKRIARARLFSYGNSLGPIVLSSNFLVPLFAVLFGPACAGLIKLASSISHAFSTVFYRAVGQTSRALFARMRSADHLEQQALFQSITTPLFNTLLGLLLFCLINPRFLGRICGATQSHDCYLLITFFVISLMENLAIAHEKLCEARERIDVILIINSIGAALVFGISLCSFITSPLTMLGLIACARAIVIITMTTVATRICRIEAPLGIRPWILVATALASFAVRLVLP